MKGFLPKLKDFSPQLRKMTTRCDVTRKHSGATKRLGCPPITNAGTTQHSGESLFFQTSVAIVIVFLAEMGKIPCCGRPESSSSII